MPPLTPLPPTSMPKPRLADPGLGNRVTVMAAPRRVRADRRVPHDSGLRRRDLCCDKAVTDNRPRGTCVRWPSNWPSRPLHSSAARRAEVFGAVRPIAGCGARARARRPTRSPSSTPRPSRCCGDGWRSCGPVMRSSARRAAVRPRRCRPARSPGCSTRSTARSTSSTAFRPTRCRWPRRSTVCRWPVRSPTSARARCSRPGSGSARTCRDRLADAALRCTDVSELSMALVGTGFGYSPRTPGRPGRGAGRAVAAGA